MLNNFFRINMPYGISRNSEDKWFAFNREYMPIGWGNESSKKSIVQDNVYSEVPVYTRFKELSESMLKKLAWGDDESIVLDKNGKIERVFFYNDRTNPTNNDDPKNWDNYFSKLKLLAYLQAG